MFWAPGRVGGGGVGESRKMENGELWENRVVSLGPLLVLEPDPLSPFKSKQAYIFPAFVAEISGYHRNHPALSCKQIYDEEP